MPVYVVARIAVSKVRIGLAKTKFAYLSWFEPASRLNSQPLTGCWAWKSEAAAASGKSLSFSEAGRKAAQMGFSPLAQRPVARARGTAKLFNDLGGGGGSGAAQDEARSRQLEDGPRRPLRIGGGNLKISRDCHTSGDRPGRHPERRLPSTTLAFPCVKNLTDRGCSCTTAPWRSSENSWSRTMSGGCQWLAV